MTNMDLWSGDDASTGAIWFQGGGKLETWEVGKLPPQSTPEFQFSRNPEIQIPPYTCCGDAFRTVIVLYRSSRGESGSWGTGVET